MCVCVCVCVCVCGVCKTGRQKEWKKDRESVSRRKNASLESLHSSSGWGWMRQFSSWGGKSLVGGGFSAWASDRSVPVERGDTLSTTLAGFPLSLPLYIDSLINASPLSLCSLQIRYLISPSIVRSRWPTRPTPLRGCPPSLTPGASRWSPPPAAATVSGQSPSWACSLVWWAMLPPAPALPQLPHKPPCPPLHLPCPPPLPPLLPLPHLRAPASAPPFTTTSPTQSTQPPQPTPVPTPTSSQTRDRFFPVRQDHCSTLPLPTQIASPVAPASPCPWFLTTFSPSSRERSAWCPLTKSPSRVSRVSPPSLLCPPSRPLPPRLAPRT